MVTPIDVAGFQNVLNLSWSVNAKLGTYVHIYMLREETVEAVTGLEQSHAPCSSVTTPHIYLREKERDREGEGKGIQRVATTYTSSSRTHTRLA
jgi:hypothetical protein